MEDENKLSVSEIDEQIKKLQQIKKEVTKSSYEQRPIREKLSYDLQPLKLFSFSIKLLIICIVTGGIIFGLGYWKGWKRKPVLLDTADFNAEVKCKYIDQIHQISLRNNKLYFDEEVTTIGQVAKLKPFGLQVFPKMFGAIGVGGASIGLGLELAHFYQFNLDTYLASDKSINAGISYDLKFKNDGKEHWFENSAIGVSVGKRFDKVEDTNIKLYWTTKF